MSTPNDVSGKIADIVASGLPLSAGLQALSEEVSSRRLKRVLRDISRRLDAGESEQDVFQQQAGAMPEDFRTLILAGLKTGQLAKILGSHLEYSTANHELRRKLWLTLSYPTLLVSFAAALVTCLLVWVVSDFKGIFMDFGTELPGITVVLINLSDALKNYGLYIFGVIVVVSLMVWGAFSLFGLQRYRARLLHAIPIIGPMFESSALAQFCHVLAMLIESRVPLPEALQAAGASTRDANIRDGCARLAEAVEAGTPLEDAVRDLPHFPAGMTDVFRWNRRPEAFPDSLHAAGDILASHANIQVGLVAVICEPIIIVTIAVTVGFVVISLFMPLVKLLNDLS